MLFHREKRDSRLHRELYRTLVQASACLCLLLCSNMVAFANPTGGSVAAGQATIQSNRNITTITQKSGSAIINWKDFSINTGETTQFIQPSSSSLILNRVTGGNVSQIMGTLSANGQIFLINPSGIIFGKGSQINVAGILASTANISDSDFMNGHYHFTNAPAGSKIINEGTITVRNAGMAALVAPSVENRGVIQATLGKVVLASGSAFTLDLYGDNLITFDATSTVNAGIINNEGNIIANGGTVLLSVAAADQLIQNVINTSGYISAQSVSSQNGKIILLGAQNSHIQVSGTLDASGAAPGQSGGLIQASATYIQLLSTSLLNAVGNIGGGTILLHAQFLTMDAGALINASALQSGNGGHVVLWSDQKTNAYGMILAQGGTLSGNGGLVETSSHQTVDFTGILVNTMAAHGLSGSWLIDPGTITIDDTAATTLTNNLLTTSQTVDTAGAGNVDFINSVQPVQLSNSNSFSVIAGTDINFNVSNAITTIGSASGNITLTAGNDINVNNYHSIYTSSTAGNISLLAQNNITFGANQAIFANGTHGQLLIYADSDLNGAGTVIITPPAGNVIISSAGPVDIFYSPTNFNSGLTPSQRAQISSGDAIDSQISMLVLNNVAGHMLTDVSSNLNGAYALGQNVNTGLGSFTPIGTLATPFTGQFNGNGFTISNLTINAPGTDNVGLFGYTSTSPTIKNVILLNSSISGHNNVGSVVGFSGGFTVLSNIFSNATVTGSNNVGGLIGRQDSSSGITILQNAAYAGTIQINSGGANIGGLVGYNDVNGRINTSLSLASILGSGVNVGGIIGNNQNSSALGDPFYSVSTFPGLAVGTGSTSGTHAGDAVSLTSSSTFPGTWNFASIWQTNGSAYYVSLRSCGSACLVSASTSTSNHLSNFAAQYTTVNAILNNNTPEQPILPNYYSSTDSTLMYGVPLPNGGGMFVISIVPNPNPMGSLNAALDTLSNAYGCSA